MNILALIPARGGSKGVPKKNIKLLNSYPLISYSIGIAKLSSKINKILVTTDSKEIADIALSYGAEVPFLRPKELASDKALDIGFIKHALDYLKEKENYEVDLLILLRPTTPLRDISLIENAIERFISSPKATSLRSSHLSSNTPFKWFSLKDEFYNTISNEVTLEDVNKPRQSFPDTYIPNGYIDIIKPEFLYKNDSLYGDKILSYITPTTFEVDTMEEFEYLEYLTLRDDSLLLKYLKGLINE